MAGLYGQVCEVSKSDTPKRIADYRWYGKQSTRAALGILKPGEKVPQKPSEYDLVMWYRLDGLLPDEYDRQRADRWQTVMALRVAAEEGVAAARDERAGLDVSRQKMQA